MWSRVWPRPKTKETWLLNLEDLNILEVTCFIFQSLDLSWTLVVLNGDSGDVLLFSHYTLLLKQKRIYPTLNFVVIAIPIHQNWSSIVTTNYSNYLNSNFCEQLGVASHVSTGQSSGNQKIKGFVQILPPMQVYNW